ncbi:glycoside hydrolase family 93 protein [Hypoxylon sp. CI-4A]|nr:glycoside hydrolase family 93 protein [Hypoxylon sp. CI-4A]
MSLVFMLLSYFSAIFTISASPIGQPRKEIHRRSLATRDTTVQFSEIDASFTLGAAESKVAASGTYPRLARLSDGGILSIATFQDGSDRVLRVSRSDDDGGSFTEIGEVARSTGDLDNGYLLQLPSGTILAAFRNHDKNADGALTYFRITVCSSTDGGRTWVFAAQAAENAASASGFNGLWEPFLRLGGDGAVQLTYSGELSQTNQETFRALSRDEGKTWSAPANLRLHGDRTDQRDGMQGIVSVQDAGSGQETLVMVFEVKEGNYVHLATVTSTNDGESWGSRSTIFQAANHNAGAPQIASVGNNLAVVFMTDEDTDASSLNWPDKATIKMIFSSELRGGQLDWTTQTLKLSDASAYWPGAFQRASNDIIAVYERGGTPYGKVVSAA